MKAEINETFSQTKDALSANFTGLLSWLPPTTFHGVLLKRKMSRLVGSGVVLLPAYRSPS